MLSFNLGGTRPLDVRASQPNESPGMQARRRTARDVDGDFFENVAAVHPGTAAGTGTSSQSQTARNGSDQVRHCGASRCDDYAGLLASKVFVALEKAAHGRNDGFRFLHGATPIQVSIIAELIVAVMMKLSRIQEYAASIVDRIRNRFP
jgi:hypothetical protein